MYESPIKIIESKIDSFSKAIIKQKDDAIFAEIQSSFGVDVDREELIRALQYDRDQYNKGYADGKRDAEADLVRCKDCKHWDEENKELYTYDSKPENKDNLVDFAECLYWSNWSTCHSTRFNDFCSLGERREG